MTFLWSLLERRSQCSVMERHWFWMQINEKLKGFNSLFSWHVPKKGLSKDITFFFSFSGAAWRIVDFYWRHIVISNLLSGSIWNSYIIWCDDVVYIWVMVSYRSYWEQNTICFWKYKQVNIWLNFGLKKKKKGWRFILNEKNFP